MPYNTAPRCPEPPENHAGRTTRERKWKHALAYVSQLWRPSNTLEQTHATVSRYAMHLIDLTTGAAYTVQQLLGTVTVAWSSITGKPTTLAGYGITDAAAASHTHAKADITDLPELLAAPLVTTTAPVDGANASGTVEWQSTTLPDESTLTIGGVVYTFRTSTPDAESNEFTTYEELAELLNEHPTVFPSLTSFSAPSSTHKVWFTARSTGIAGNSISASASDAGLILETMSGGLNSTPQADYPGQLLVLQWTPTAGAVNVYVASSAGHTAWMPFVIND